MFCTVLPVLCIHMHRGTAGYGTSLPLPWKSETFITLDGYNNSPWQPTKQANLNRKVLSVHCKCAVQPEIVAVRKLICSEARSGLRWDFHYDTNVVREIWLRCNEIYSKDWVRRCYQNPHSRCEMDQDAASALTRSCLTYHLCLLSSSSPLVFFFPFLASIFLSPSLPSSFCIWFARCKKRCLSVFRNPLLSDRNIWLGGRPTCRKIVEKNVASGMLLLSLSLFFAY